MNRKALGIAAAVILAALGTFGIVRYVQTAEDRALAGEETVAVLVVQQPVEQGTPASALEGHVVTERVPAKVRAATAVASLDDLDGEQVSLVDLVPGEQVVADRFGTTETLAQQAGVEVPAGHHLATLKLAPERAVGGQLRPGDRVAVTATFNPFEGNGADGNVTPNATRTLLHKVLVVDVVGDGTADAADGDAAADAQAAGRLPGDTWFVTLALAAPEVEQVIFAAEEGRVWLTSEPDDAPEDTSVTRTRDNIFPAAG